MSVNDAGRHAREALCHGLGGKFGPVAGTAVHHLVVAL